MMLIICPHHLKGHVGQCLDISEFQVDPLAPQNRKPAIFGFNRQRSTSNISHAKTQPQRERTELPVDEKGKKRISNVGQETAEPQKCLSPLNPARRGTAGPGFRHSLFLV
jgi:hypothetical protein